MQIYLRTEVLGTVSFDNTSWFSGYDEKFFFGKGAFYSACHPKGKLPWMLYFAFRTHRRSKLSFTQKLKWLRLGGKSFASLTGFDELSQNNTD